MPAGLWALAHTPLCGAARTGTNFREAGPCGGGLNCKGGKQLSCLPAATLRTFDVVLLFSQNDLLKFYRALLTAVFEYWHVGYYKAW